MEWLTYLVLLLCPLMMIFCIKGMSSHKQHHSHSSNELDSKMSLLIDENEKLRKEVDALSTLVKKEL